MYILILTDFPLKLKAYKNLLKPISYEIKNQKEHK